MIRDAHDANETTKTNDFELTRLRAALPEYFVKDGGFRLDRLQDALSSTDVSMTRGATTSSPSGSPTPST